MQLSPANGPWYLGGSTPHRLPALPMPDLIPQSSRSVSSPFTPQPLLVLWRLPDNKLSNDKDGEVAVAGARLPRRLRHVPAAAGCRQAGVKGCD